MAASAEPLWTLLLMSELSARGLSCKKLEPADEEEAGAAAVAALAEEAMAEEGAGPCGVAGGEGGGEWRRLPFIWPLDPARVATPLLLPFVPSAPGRVGAPSSRDAFISEARSP